MRRRLTRAGLILSAAFLVMACSNRTPRAAANRLAASEDWTTIKLLMPGDAVGILGVVSVEHLQNTLGDIVEEFGHEPPDLLEIMAERLPLSREDIDPARPLALGVALTASDPPAPLFTLALPVRDENSALAMMRSLPVRTRATGQGYIGISSSRQYDAGDALSGIAAQPPLGDISLRIDLRTLVDAYRVWVDQGLALLQFALSQSVALEGTDFQERALSWATLFVDSASELNVGINEHDSRLHVRARLETTENIQTALIPGTKSIALVEAMRCLSGRSPVLTLQSVNLKPLVEWMSALQMAAIAHAPSQPTDEEQNEQLEISVLTSRLQALTAVPNWAAFSFVDPGVEWIQVFMPDDVEAYVNDVRDLIEASRVFSPVGLEIESEPPVGVLGGEMQDLTLTFDVAALDALASGHHSAADVQGIVERLLGGERIQVQMATVDDFVIFTSHPEKKIMKRVLTNLRKRKPSKMPAAVREMLAQNTLPPTAYVDFNLREILKYVAPLFHEVASHGAVDRARLRDARSGKPARVQSALWASDGTYEFEISGELAEIAEILRDFTSLFEDDELSDL